MQYYVDRTMILAAAQHYAEKEVESFTPIDDDDRQRLNITITEHFMAGANFILESQKILQVTL